MLAQSNILLCDDSPFPYSEIKQHIMRIKIIYFLVIYSRPSPPYTDNARTDAMYWGFIFLRKFCNGEYGR